jgi:menaquinone-dependent protoporphyrinogen oxidase
MRVLVTAASRHGATAEIAQAIGAALHGQGLDVTVLPVEEVTTIEPYGAVVVGSAVYAGHWLRPAIGFVTTHTKALTVRPVWLFSSGPVGEPPMPADTPVDATETVSMTHARGHRVFAGKLDRRTLGWAEKAVAIALHAPEGDFRDWDAIRAWAAEVGTTLRAATAA